MNTTDAAAIIHLPPSSCAPPQPTPSLAAIASGITITLVCERLCANCCLNPSSPPPPQQQPQQPPSASSPSLSAATSTSVPSSTSTSVPPRKPSSCLKRRLSTHSLGLSVDTSPATVTRSSSESSLPTPVSPPTSPATDPASKRRRINPTQPCSSTPPSPPPSPSELIQGIKSKLLAYQKTQILTKIVANALRTNLLPPHAIPLALYYVKRLLELPVIPKPLSSPDRLLVAALMIAEVQLVDRPLSTRAWARILAASLVPEWAFGRVLKNPKVVDGMVSAAQMARIKMEALVALEFRVHVEEGAYRLWLESIAKLGMAF
ncbi:hypothetical protein HDU67_004693 [Dinochytrium kinnereticum]|nr:hypothetical protein HDU67_004693 [Dinochytrium kinnereticum]